jgi:Ni/Co efflux regulator RcnB
MNLLKRAWAGGVIRTARLRPGFADLIQVTVALCNIYWVSSTVPVTRRQMIVMNSSKKVVLGLAVAALMGAGTLVMAEPPHEDHAPAPARGEPHPGPKGYARVEPPKGALARPPANFDRKTYQHNFQAARSFKVGPYNRPAGWSAHHWGFGDHLPPAYFASQYILADYWLFSLEVPPVGYEWVRDDTDALLVNTSTGEILQVEYGVFG